MRQSKTTMTADDVRKIIANKCAKRGTQSVFAKQLGISQTYLNDIIHGRRAIADAVCEMLNIERVVSFRKIRKSNGR
jgi:DNA-binding transcriptional regulator YdaS (Cro superfamily)